LIKVAYHPPAILSNEEIEQLLDALGTLQMQAIAMVACGAGLRASEVINLAGQGYR
jgi:integrase